MEPRQATAKRPAGYADFTCHDQRRPDQVVAAGTTSSVVGRIGLTSMRPPHGVKAWAKVMKFVSPGAEKRTVAALGQTRSPAPSLGTTVQAMSK
jgi:hypothetical protein